MDAGGLSLSDAPAALSRQQRIAFAAIALAVAATRWPALSRTLWDWDEALFGLALRNYDVTLHHPHPPGFPLFIACAKAIAAIGSVDAFHALRAVSFAASLVVFPAMFFLAHELRARFFVSIAAALLLAFFPNVWFYGGTATSDVPSLVLVVVASALLLRGCRSTPSLLAGAVVLGIAVGFRPQNLIIGCAPAILALIHRRRAAIAGGLIVAGIVIASYGTAAALSGGWGAYSKVVEQHQRYIRETDSFLAPRHPGLIQVADDFFLRPYRAPAINIAVSLLALLGLRKRRTWHAAAIFGPFLIFAWLFLDFHSVSRFSIGYMPLFALAAAEGIPLPGAAVTLAGMIALLVGWTWPLLRVVHETPSPPVAAIRSIEPGTIVYVDDRLAAHADLLMPAFERHTTTNAPPVVAHENAVLLREGASQAPGAKNFSRPRQRLAGVARARYFEVSVVPARHVALSESPTIVRATFPPGSHAGTLTLRIRSSGGAAIRVDGAVLDRVPPGTVDRRWTVSPPHELVIEAEKGTVTLERMTLSE